MYFVYSDHCLLLRYAMQSVLYIHTLHTVLYCKLGVPGAINTPRAQNLMNLGRYNLYSHFLILRKVRYRFQARIDAVAITKLLHKTIKYTRAESLLARNVRSPLRLYQWAPGRICRGPPPRSSWSRCSEAAPQF